MDEIEEVSYAVKNYTPPPPKMFPEDTPSRKQYMAYWRDKNREHVRTYSRLWKRRQRVAPNNKIKDNK